MADIQGETTLINQCIANVTAHEANGLRCHCAKEVQIKKLGMIMANRRISHV